MGYNSWSCCKSKDKTTVHCTSNVKASAQESEEEPLDTNKIPGALRVPEDCATVLEAFNLARHRRRIHTIVLGKGKHTVDVMNEKGHEYLVVDFPINIFGRTGVKQNQIVVDGGFYIKKHLQRIIHIKNLTVRHSKGAGVFGLAPFTLEDVTIEQCGEYGIFASGAAGVARCKNVQIRKCGSSGVVAADGGSTTFFGTKNSTVVCHNNAKGFSNCYGITVNGSALSKIQFVHPLSKEIVSKKNRKDKNWGASGGAAVNQIQNVSEEDETWGGEDIFL